MEREYKAMGQVNFRRPIFKEKICFRNKTGRHCTVKSPVNNSKMGKKVVRTHQSYRIIYKKLIRWVQSEKIRQQQDRIPPFIFEATKTFFFCSPTGQIRTLRQGCSIKTCSHYWQQNSVTNHGIQAVIVYDQICSQIRIRLRNSRSRRPTEALYITKQCWDPDPGQKVKF